MEKTKCGGKSFKALLVTQFFGAFNDNAFKIIISLLALKTITGSEAGANLISSVGALFIIPFIIFSPYAGFCADKFSKRNVIVSMKIAEAVIMSMGFWALTSNNVLVYCIVLFFMATQSALFSPSKYGILPEILEDNELSRGNGYLQMWTFLAIILGTACGGQIIEVFRNNIYFVPGIFLFFSVVGIIASLFITKVPPANSGKKFEINFLKVGLGTLKEIKQNKTLFNILISMTYFWFLGAVFQMNSLLYGKNILILSDVDISVLLVVVSIGIGAGSLFAGKCSEGKVELGLVPLGAFGMSTFSIILGIPPAVYQQVLICLFFLGVSGGVFIVPLNAYFQQKSPKDRRGRYLAASSITSSFAILLGSFFLWIMGVKFHFDAAQIFLVLGIASVGITIYIITRLPVFLLRFFNWGITHSLYKVKVVDSKYVPKTGGALLVCNHVSYMDPPLILSSLQRSIRFLTHRTIYNNFFIKPFCKIMKAIPISLNDKPKTIMKALQHAREAILQGHLVCIFAEGGLTRTGNMLAFNRGFEYIMKGVDAPIIPVHIDRIWGSIFSFENGKYFWKVPKIIPYPITISYGRPLPSNSKTYQVRGVVQELSADAFKYREKEQKKLHIHFIEETKKHPFKFCMADSTKIKLNYAQALGRVLLLSKVLFKEENKECRENEMVGVMLPSSCIGALVNGAVLLSGKVPVNLNFTASKENILSAIKQCGIKKIITSKLFLRKIKMDKLDDMIFVEDLIKNIPLFQKLLSSIAAFILPSFLIKYIYVKGNRDRINDTATVIFSSGSTGEPKGVLLSHANIFSNIEGFYQVLKLGRKDVMMGVLPFFHSFGFTATLCASIGIGMGVVYHSNPLDAGTIGRLVKQYKAAILLGTPTFFSSYIKKCSKEEFASLKFAMAGAEKLKQNLIDAFFEKFKIIPFEGYGATELSPIVSLGLPDYISEDKRIKQIRYKQGKVGQPIPGVAVKVVSEDNLERLPYNTEGLLMVKGPNVMKGYLNLPEKTKEVIKEGWYVTGDIGTIDDDGFIHITGRLSRFSKIGGEMVPHIKVEEEIFRILNISEPLCTVTSVSDEKKGEKLIVLYKGDLDVNSLWENLKNSDIPKLWIPKKDSFYRVKEIPLLGSGKLDLKKIKAIAIDLVEGNKIEEEENG